MLTQLEQRLNRLHAALDDASAGAVPLFQWQQEGSDQHIVDFSQSRSTAQLANILGVLIGNIASLKDHLKAWCQENNRTFNGEKLIDTNRDVAVIHDLWNRDKHGALSRPRSGYRPMLQHITQSIEVSSLNGEGSSLEGITDTETGETRLRPGPNSKLALVVDAEIVDESGEPLGMLLNVCDRAIDAWTSAFKIAGFTQ